MAYSKTEQTVLNMSEAIAKENGCYIYDVEYVKEGGDRYLRVYADKEDGGITIDECEIISRSLGEKLDEINPIKENYILEVSSPGIERKLKTPEHFNKYIGETIDVGLYKAVNKSKVFIGKLENYVDGKIIVTADGQSEEFLLSETSYVKLHFDF